MTSGLGFIAVALVYFGGWKPAGVLGGALLFSMVNFLQLWIQVLGIPIPSDIAVMMPYVLTILVLVADPSPGCVLHRLYPNLLTGKLNPGKEAAQSKVYFNVRVQIDNQFVP